MKILRSLTILVLIALIFRNIASTPRSQSQKLLGKYQLEGSNTGIEFLRDNNAVLHSTEFRGGIAMKYEIMDGVNGQTIRFDGPFLDGQIANFYRKDDAIILANAGGDRLFQKVDGFSFYGEGSAVEAMQIEGEGFAANINHLQMIHLVEFGRFATDVSQFDYDIALKPENYSFSLEKVGQDLTRTAVFVHATSPGLKSYLGAVDAKGLQDEDEDTLASIVCETDDPTASLPATVNFQDGLVCPPSLSRVR